MGFLGRKGPPDNRYLPETIDAVCIGEKCPNFRGDTCSDTKMVWMTAGGPTEKRDTSKPPLRDEASYIIYGQLCLTGKGPNLVAQRAEVFKPDEISAGALLAETGRYGDMPIQFVEGDAVTSISTYADSHEL